MTTATREYTFSGIYEIPEAARYIHADIRLPQNLYPVHSSDLIRWVRMGLADPELRSVSGRSMLLDFEDLISMRVIAFLRALKYSFKTIRSVEANLREITGHDRPFATEQLWAEKLGAVNIYTQINQMLISLTHGNQGVFMDFVKDRLIDVHGLTFNQMRLAESWTPAPGITLNPQIQFGRPCIAGTRIPTADIVGMLDAGDTASFLAKSFGIAPEQIDKAKAWERKLTALPLFRRQRPHAHLPDLRRSAHQKSCVHSGCTQGSTLYARL